MEKININWLDCPVIKHSFVAEMIGMKQATFSLKYHKAIRNRFTEKDLVKIEEARKQLIKILSNESGKQF